MKQGIYSRSAMAGQMLVFVCSVYMVSATCSLARAAACSPKSMSSRYYGATVFRDRSPINGQQDAHEKLCTTDQQGRFRLPKGSGRWTLKGGFEIGSGRQNPFVLMSPSGARAIGMLSTIWQTIHNQGVRGRRIPLMLGLPKTASLKQYSLVQTNKKKLRVWQQKDAQLHTLLEFALAGSQETPESLVNTFTTVLRQLPSPLDLTDGSRIRRLLTESAPSMSLSPDDLDAVLTTARAFNVQILNRPAQLDGLARIRANATEALEGKNFACLSSCFTESGIVSQLEGKSCSCATPSPTPSPSPSSTPLPSPIETPSPTPSPTPGPGFANLEISQLDADTSSGDPARPDLLSDFITMGPVRALHGTAGSDVVQVILTQDGVELPPVPVNGGKWAYAFPPSGLALGDHTFVAFGRNAAGEAMPGTATRVVTVTRKPPLRPSTNPDGISETQLPAWIPTVRPDPNNPDDKPWFVVTMPPNGRAFAELREIGANGEIGPALGPYAVRIAADGFVQIYIADLLAPSPSTYNVKLYVSDAAGNQSCASSVDVNDPECPKDSIPGDNSLTVADSSALQFNPPWPPLRLSGFWSGGEPAGLGVSVQRRADPPPAPTAEGNPITLDTGAVRDASVWSVDVSANNLAAGTYDVTATYEYVNRTVTVTSDSTPRLTGKWSGTDPSHLAISICPGFFAPVDPECASPSFEGVIGNGLSVSGTDWFLAVPDDLNLGKPEPAVPDPGGLDPGQYRVLTIEALVFEPFFIPETLRVDSLLIDDTGTLTIP